MYMSRVSTTNVCYKLLADSWRDHAHHALHTSAMLLLIAAYQSHYMQINWCHDTDNVCDKSSGCQDIDLQKPADSLQGTNALLCKMMPANEIASCQQPRLLAHIPSPMWICNCCPVLLAVW